MLDPVRKQKTVSRSFGWWVTQKHVLEDYEIRMAVLEVAWAEVMQSWFTVSFDVCKSKCCCWLLFSRLIPVFADTRCADFLCCLASGIKRIRKLPYNCHTAILERLSGTITTVFLIPCVNDQKCTEMPPVTAVIESHKHTLRSDKIRYC